MSVCECEDGCDGVGEFWVGWVWSVKLCEGWVKRSVMVQSGVKKYVYYDAYVFSKQIGHCLIAQCDTIPFHPITIPFSGQLHADGVQNTS